MEMLPRKYVVRWIQDSDREEHARRVARAKERGDPDEVAIINESFAEWEQEQGREHERLACPVCGDSLLVPTKAGTSRPHARRQSIEPSWDHVRRLRTDIKTLQAELDSALESLESASDSHE